MGINGHNWQYCIYFVCFVYGRITSEVAEAGAGGGLKCVSCHTLGDEKIAFRIFPRSQRPAQGKVI